MTRVEFRLSMPGRSSWDGRWSGDGRNYTTVRSLTNEAAAKLFAVEGGFTAHKSWTHRWSDGWCAQIEARIVRTGERLKKSDGFCGYSWMVDNIIRTGTPYAEVTS